MKPLEPPETHHLSAAFGWLGLGNWREAALELEKLSPEFRNHPEALPAWYQICARQQQWGAAAKFAQELVHTSPEDSQSWIWHAYAIRRMSGGGLQQARAILVKAHELFPTQPMICYNLACYDCQLGDLTEAWEWLEKALVSSNLPVFKAFALADRDLEPLWEKIKGLGVIKSA
jgi:Flp pilus assembly protein TadD